MMKKLSLLVMLCAFAVITYGQAKVELGLKGGLNVANINTKDANATYESATGMNVGPYLLVKVANIGIQPEVLYSSQGTDYTATIAGVQYALKERYSYLNVPVMLKLYMVAGLNLQVGPQFGILMDATGDELTITSGNTTVSRDQSYKDQIKGSDVSAAFGLGWDAPLGLKFSARYVMGLSDINETSGGSEKKNRTFQLAVGFRLFKMGS